MTIITPGKSKFRIDMPILLIGAILIGFSFWFVLVYSQVVSLEHQVRAAERAIENLKVTNAESKNTLFEATAPKKLLQVASDRNLLRVNTPLYLEVGKPIWVSVSRY